ncbi:hypothetical protein COHA_000543 [Chlorella ohadii]|uniref:Uncharacterized protein n=1 Tax=Chlorella ohadii TaxID=2649997 RepID=A0AAD5DX05_9CHLO|nr:hypothetical protein COHA_000543 [Chlorella ohadii]
MSSSAELLKAATKGDARTVKRLLQAGGLPNAKGAHGNTALHLAAAGGHTGCIKALLDSRATADVHAADGCTPLHRAAANGHGEACAALLAGGASPDAVTPKRVTPLLMACEAGHASAVAALMAGGASADAKNPAGATPAQLAIAAGHAAAVAALVAGGLDPNSRLPDSGLSLLEAAAHHGRGEVITALIRGGADVDATNGKGDNALHKLVQSWKDSKMLPNGKMDGNTERYSAAAQALLDGGADPWSLNYAGKSAITLAADRGNTRLQQLFVKAVPCPRECLGCLLLLL